MRNENFLKTFYAEATITKHRIVKHGAADNGAVQAAAVGDSIIGVVDSIGGATGEPVDVIIDGIATVEYGGNVTRGALLTTDASGKAVAAAPAAGANNRIIGVAMVSGVSGDLGAVRISLGTTQG